MGRGRQWQRTGQQINLHPFRDTATGLRTAEWWKKSGQKSDNLSQPGRVAVNRNLPSQWEGSLQGAWAQLKAYEISLVKQLKHFCIDSLVGLFGNYLISWIWDIIAFLSCSKALGALWQTFYNFRIQGLHRGEFPFIWTHSSWNNFQSENQNSTDQCIWETWGLATW